MREPKKPPRGNMDTVRDQSKVRKALSIGLSFLFE